MQLLKKEFYVDNAWFPVVLDPSGHYLAFEIESCLRIFDRQTGQRIVIPEDDDPVMFFSMDFSPDGHYLVGDYSQQLDVFETQNWTVCRQITLESHNKTAHHAMAFSPSGQHLAIIYQNNLIDILYFEQGYLQARLERKPCSLYNGRRYFEAPQDVVSFCYHPTGQYIAAGYMWCAMDFDFCIWDVKSQAPLFISEMTSFIPRHLKFSPCGKFLVVSLAESGESYGEGCAVIHVYKLMPERLALPMQLVLVHELGTYVYADEYKHLGMEMYNSGYEIYSDGYFDITPDGKSIIAWMADCRRNNFQKYIVVWDFHTGEQVLKKQVDCGYRVLCLPDNKRFLTGNDGYRHFIEMWELSP